MRPSAHATASSAGLHVDGPAQFGQLLLDIGQCVSKRRTTVRTRSPFREDAFALQFEGLELAFAFRSFGAHLGGGRFWRIGLRLLFFHGFTLPSTRHTSSLRRPV